MQFNSAFRKFLHLNTSVLTGVFVFGALFIGLSAEPAQALTVNPRLEYDADPGSTIHSTIQILNDERQTRTFYLRSENFNSEDEAGVIHAANTSTAQTNYPMSGLVNAIAQKFNLNASDVQQVFDQQRDQMDAEHQQKFEARVAQGVKDGKITQDQADQIVAKAQELQAARQSEQANSANQTEAERDAARKAQMDSLKQWATQNNIPKEFMLFGGMGHGGPGHHENRNN